MQLEKRSFLIKEARVESSEAGQTIEGYAAVFDSDSVDIGFIERLQPGAFTRSLKDAAEKPDTNNIFAFWSHDTSQPIGSTRSGKLSLSEDKHGLAFKLSAQRLNAAQIDAVRDGDMKMSFGFLVPPGGDSWSRREDGQDVRLVNTAELFEVSPVAMPAYPDTSAAMRALEQYRSQRSAEEAAAAQEAEKRAAEKTAADAAAALADRLAVIGAAPVIGAKLRMKHGVRERVSAR